MTNQQLVNYASSPCKASLKKNDVFISFRGEDTRDNFTSHLYCALIQTKFNIYIDNKVEKGDEISQALSEAIQESQVSVVIFSENYATSKWCLDEITKIIECQKNQGQVVIPVFYKVDPSHVKKQGGSFEKAFAEHERDLKIPNYKVKKWRKALTTAANLGGWASLTYRTEAELIEEIVKDVRDKLNLIYPIELKGLVGIEGNYARIESLLKIGSREVRKIGICGMRGIGKTTLATALYVKLFSQFEARCFLPNVREKSEKQGLDVLHRTLLSELFPGENLSAPVPKVENKCISSRLSRKKVFVVLDGVASSEQLEVLTSDFDCLGPGSIVIVTTRDKYIFSHVDEIYEVEELNHQDSLQLFCLNAFKENHPKNGFEDLSKSVIAYCRGNPLALKFFGAHLHSKSEQAWMVVLRMLQKIRDLPMATNLEALSLSQCRSPCQVHPFILLLPKLQDLDLEGFTEIQSLQMSSLKDFLVYAVESQTSMLDGTHIQDHVLRRPGDFTKLGHASLLRRIQKGEASDPSNIFELLLGNADGERSMDSNGNSSCQSFGGDTKRESQSSKERDDHIIPFDTPSASNMDSNESIEELEENDLTYNHERKCSEAVMSEKVHKLVEDDNSDPEPDWDPFAKLDSMLCDSYKSVPMPTLSTTVSDTEVQGPNVAAALEKLETLLESSLETISSDDEVKQQCHLVLGQLVQFEDQVSVKILPVINKLKSFIGSVDVRFVTAQKTIQDYNQLLQSRSRISRRFEIVKARRHHISSEVSEREIQFKKINCEIAEVEQKIGFLVETRDKLKRALDDCDVKNNKLKTEVARLLPQCKTVTTALKDSNISYNAAQTNKKRVEVEWAELRNTFCRTNILFVNAYLDI